MIYSSAIRIGENPPPLPKGKIRYLLYSFLDDIIPLFCDWISHEDNWKNKNENFYNQRLARFLNRKRTESCPFDFVHQSSQGVNRSLDIGVHISSDSGEAIFGIEGKRLPTGADNKRAREYLFFDDPKKIYGAVERFKHHLHGVNMRDSMIVGYIQKETIQYWHAEINSWIDDLIIQSNRPMISWSEDDKLKQYSNFVCAHVSKFKSINSRLTGMQPIVLLHYLMQL